MSAPMPEYIKTCLAVFFGIVFFYMVRANVAVTIEPMSFDPKRDPQTIHPTKNYTESQSGWILSSFYIGYMLCHVAGGIYCTLFGYRNLFIACVAFCTLFTLLMPLSAKLGFPILILNRIVSGVASSSLYPLSHDVIARWVPVSQMTRLGSATLTGSSIGLILNFMIGGPVCQSELPFLGWTTFIYFNGAIGVVSLILVYFFIYDSPEQHPRITDEEKKVIAKDRHPHPKYHIKDIPFKKILTSKPFIATCVMHGGNNFGIYSLTSLSVKYLKKERHFSVRDAGFITSGVFALMIISQFIVSSIVNNAIKNNGLQRTKYKKWSNTAGAVITSICMMFVPIVASDVLRIILMCLSGVAFAFFIPGYFTGMIDMCHEMAAIVMGIANVVGSASGVLCPIVASKLLIAYKDDPRKAWIISFAVIVSYVIFGAIVWAIWGDCEDQGWVTTDQKNSNTTLINSMSHIHEEHV